MIMRFKKVLKKKILHKKKKIFFTKINLNKVKLDIIPFILFMRFIQYFINVAAYFWVLLFPNYNIRTTLSEKSSFLT